MIPPTPILGYAPINNGYMTPVMNYATSMNQLPLTSVSGGGLYNDNASFRYSHQNLSGRASSFILNSPSIMNGQQQQHMSPPSIYSDGSGGGGGAYPMIQNNSMMDSNMYHQPTDEEIRREVQRITSTADLMTMTKKQVREQLSRHFGINMSYRKDFINFCIEESLNY
jgi:chitin synthase